MSVRKRLWNCNGSAREAWVVDFRDVSGKRRHRTFTTKRDAERFHGVTKAVGPGQIPEPMTKGYRPLEFTAPLPSGGWRKGSGRAAIVEAVREQCPGLKPSTGGVVVHVIAEMAPAHVVADVDNLLKPALDALKGIVWMDDTQVCELLVRRIPGRNRCLHIKVWQIPNAVVASYLNALAQAGPYDERSIYAER